MAVKPDLGLSDKARRLAADQLSAVLANHSALALKTQNYHWNVSGPHFQGLHALFGAQYDALALAIDEIAERIRTLGHTAPGGLAAFAKLATVKDASGREDWKAMLAALASDNDALVRQARQARDKVEAAGDAETGDLLIGRMEALGKAAWMLRSHLGS
ncbi:MAG: DNA starvation/stationary phase protection protein [Alphaproteobacteria bacterium]|nr:DNA starvation/stationary phase protection protein [Alphaproteobacteria bacterium]